jgi:uridylate kinase
MKRVLVKASGEALMGPDQFGLHPPTVHQLARDVAQSINAGFEIAVVVGGGNIFRGLQGAAKGIDRATADSMGMLATVMNALALETAIEQAGVSARTLSAVAMPSICETYTRQGGLDHISKGRCVVLAGGTGNPFFTTDTGAALRAIELKCEALLKATNVDGVYDADPKKNPGAKRFDEITHDEAIARNLAVMDTAAFALARENALPIVVFSIKSPSAIQDVLEGRGKFTRVVPSFEERRKTRRG